MTDHAMRKCQPPPRFGQKSKQIVVGDMVKARYGNTSNYWPAKVLAIDDGHMTPSATSVHHSVMRFMRTVEAPKCTTL
jgi:hypothetical protein